MSDGPRIPGQLIEDLLVERGWSRRLLATILAIDETGLNKVIQGKRPVTAKLAVALGEVLGRDPEKFLELQKDYDLEQERLFGRPDPGRAKRARLFGDLPVSAMISRGWIDAPDVRDVGRVENELARFFGAPSVDEIEILPHAAKKTQVAASVTPTQLAWLYRVRQIASNMIVGRFSQESCEAAIRGLKPLLSAPEHARKVTRILTEAGIRLVFVESLPGAKIDGVCFWLSDGAPVIGLSLRFDRMDNFWFVLRHELEHVLQGHGRNTVMLDADLNDPDQAALSDEEAVANLAAAEFCVPQKSLVGFIARKAPLFSTRDILGFAKTKDIHPAIVAGQLQRHLNDYGRFRALHEPIRKHAINGAMVDGWGDVAPFHEEAQWPANIK